MILNGKGSPNWLWSTWVQFFPFFFIRSVTGVTFRGGGGGVRMSGVIMPSIYRCYGEKMCLSI